MRDLLTTQRPWRVKVASYCVSKLYFSTLPLGLLPAAGVRGARAVRAGKRLGTAYRSHASRFSKKVNILLQPLTVEFEESEGMVCPERLRMRYGTLNRRIMPESGK